MMMLLVSLLTCSVSAVVHNYSSMSKIEEKAVSKLVFRAKSTTRDKIRAEGDFHKKICIVERTNKAEIRPEEQNEKTESCRENLWNKIQLKGL